MQRPPLRNINMTRFKTKVPEWRCFVVCIYLNSCRYPKWFQTAQKVHVIPASIRSGPLSYLFDIWALSWRRKLWDSLCWNCTRRIVWKCIIIYCKWNIFSHSTTLLLSSNPYPVNSWQYLKLGTTGSNWLLIKLYLNRFLSLSLYKGPSGIIVIFTYDNFYHNSLTPPSLPLW